MWKSENRRHHALLSNACYVCGADIGQECKNTSTTHTARKVMQPWPQWTPYELHLVEKYGDLITMGWTDHDPLAVITFGADDNLDGLFSDRLALIQEVERRAGGGTVEGAETGSD